MWTETEVIDELRVVCLIIPASKETFVLGCSYKIAYVCMFKADLGLLQLGGTITASYTVKGLQMATGCLMQILPKSQVPLCRSVLSVC